MPATRAPGCNQLARISGGRENTRQEAGLHQCQDVPGPCAEGTDNDPFTVKGDGLRVSLLALSVPPGHWLCSMGGWSPAQGWAGGGSRSAWISRDLISLHLLLHVVNGLVHSVLASAHLIFHFTSETTGSTDEDPHAPPQGQPPGHRAAASCSGSPEGGKTSIQGAGLHQCKTFVGSCTEEGEWPFHG